jgi:hypothetical protein
MRTGTEYIVNNFLTITQVTSKKTTMDYIIENLKSDKDNCIINENNIITKKIDEYGFPSCMINQFLTDNSDKACMTGSFLLHSLMNDPKWTPGDIDIFIYDKNGYYTLNIYKDLENMLNSDDERGVADDEKYVFTKKKHISNNYSVRYIENIFECTSRTNPKNKLQIINVNLPVLEVLDAFDYDIIKMRYNGKQLFIPQKTLEMINSRKIEMPTQYATMNELSRQIKRYDKYKRRNFNFNSVPIITIQVSYGELEKQIEEHDYIEAPSDDEDELYEDKLKLEKAKIKRLESHVNELETRNESIKHAISTEEKADYELKLKKCKEQIVDLEEGISELEGEVCEFIGKNKDLEGEIDEIEGENEKYEETIKNLEKENKILKAKLERAIGN